MTRIADDFTNLESDSDLFFTENRWNQYRSLFQKTSLSGGLVRRDDDTIFFIYWVYGLITGGERKGYVYSKKPLQLVVDSLDDIPIPVEEYKPIYKQITENWYMYYELGD